jgi:hypothetical protein
MAFSRAATSVAMGFSDKDNALPADFSIALDPDATFVSVDIDSIDLAINGQRSASQVSLPQGMKIRFDDLSCPNFAKHINIDVPSLQIRLLAPLFGRSAPWMEVSCPCKFRFPVLIHIFSSGGIGRYRYQRCDRVVR